MISTIIGTRPEIIKISELIRLLDRDFEHIFIFTNQHYSPEMSRVFFDELEIREPDYYLNANSSKYTILFYSINKKLKEVRPEYVICYGDTNSTLAAALAAVKIGSKLIHIEAGLRSYDKEMPEEINRVLTDQYSDFLFTPTKLTKFFLEREGIKQNVFIVGNTIVDVCLKYEKKVKKSKILKDLGLKTGEYLLLTLHRQETVDKKNKLIDIINGLKLTQENIIYPVHPRTKKNIEKFKIKIPENIRLIPPVSYFDFLNLLKNCSIILTDSGGVQEEAITLKIPCLTLRKSTERWESIICGGNFLVGTCPELIRYYVKMILDSELKEKMKKTTNPYGDGTASKKILSHLKNII